jgi:hypothetical protein
MFNAVFVAGSTLSQHCFNIVSTLTVTQKYIIGSPLLQHCHYFWLCGTVVKPSQAPAVWQLAIFTVHIMHASQLSRRPCM